jgi:amidase
MDGSLWRLSAGDIAARVGSRTVSAREVMRQHLARLEAVNPVINAVCTVNPNAAAEADAIDRRLDSGAAPRPLEGVPFLVKDNIETAGVRTTYGSLTRADYVPKADSISVARLKAAGAVLLGKANTPEFAHDVTTTNKLFGMTRNPWNPEYTSGGSSGGPGAGVAGGIAPIALGTDLGGSIRVPASFNGIVGMRPSAGRVPAWPAPLAWENFVYHVQGPLTRNIGDLCLAMAELCGPDDRDPASLPPPAEDYRAVAATRRLDGARILYVRDFGGEVPTEHEVGEVTRRAAARFTDLGARVDEGDFDIGDLRAILAGTRAFGMVARYSDLLAQHRDKMQAQLINQVEASLAYTVADIAKAELGRTAYYHRMREVMATYDFVVTPTAGITAYRLDRDLPTHIGGKKVERFYDSILGLYAFSVTGFPVVAVPAGFTSDGLPIGMQIMARRLRDDRALAAAAAYEALCPEAFRMPDVETTWRRTSAVETTTTGYTIGKDGSTAQARAS